MNRFHEFHCLFDSGVDEISGHTNYDMGTVSIDLTHIIAFNPFTKKGYTVVRLVDGNCFIVDYSYDNFKQLMARQFVTTSN